VIFVLEIKSHGIECEYAIMRLLCQSSCATYFAGDLTDRYSLFAECTTKLNCVEIFLWCARNNIS